MFRTLLPVFALTAACQVQTAPGVDPSFVSLSEKQAIVGGQDAQPGQFPYQANLRLQGTFICGGVILDKRSILTSANCVHGTEIGDLSVATGSGELLGGDVHWVERVEVHPGFDGVANDIALVRLVTDRRSGSAATLVTATRDADLTAPGTVASLSGWGTTEADAPDYPDALQYGDLELQSLESCAAHWGEQVTSRQLCAAETSVQTCTGDAGSPLVVAADGGWAVAGLMSFNASCDLDGTPSVFSRVSAYVDWLTAHGVEPTLLDDTPAEPDDLVSEQLEGGGTRHTVTGTLVEGVGMVYPLVVPVGSRIQARTLSNLDTYGRVLTGSGEEVANDDDGGEDLNFSIDHVAEHGEVDLLVQGYDDTVTGTYELVIDLLPPGAAVDEPEPSPWPDAIELGELADAEVLAQFSGNGTVFRFSTSEALTIYSHWPDSIDTVAALFDVDGQTLTTDDDGGEDRHFELSTPGAGTYYLRVARYDGTPGEFWVSFNPTQ